MSNQDDLRRSFDVVCAVLLLPLYRIGGPRRGTAEWGFRGFYGFWWGSGVWVKRALGLIPSLVLAPGQAGLISRLINVGR